MVARRSRGVRSRALAAATLGGLLVFAASAASAASARARVASARSAARHTFVAPVRHVFVIVLENKEYAVTFGPGRPFAPYLTETLPAEGALVPNYFGTGHDSADNYIAMISGQPPTSASKEDCPDPLTTLPPTEENGVAQGGGCVYPANFKTVGDQLAARRLTWKAYVQNIPSPCSLLSGGPGDYARKHNPFPFFLSVRESGECATNDVGLTELPAALKRHTPNVNFIFPDECADGHSDCTATEPTPVAQEEADELQQTNAFLQTWVPQITASRAFRRNGLLVIVWDEGDDIRSCCGEPSTDPDGSSPGGEEGVPGDGGGQTGAIMLSPFIKGGIVSEDSYNHYSLLASIEEMFGLPRLGEARLPSTTVFGKDIFTAAP